MPASDMYRGNENTMYKQSTRIIFCTEGQKVLLCIYRENNKLKITWTTSRKCPIRWFFRKIQNSVLKDTEFIFAFLMILNGYPDLCAIIQQPFS